MRLRNIFLIIIAVICLASECDDKYIRFENPVPENAKTVMHFANNYIGRYYRTTKNYNEFLDADSVYLSIQDKLIIKENVLIEKFAQEDFDTMQNLVIKEGLIYDLESNDSIGYPYILENDSMIVKYIIEDTVFNINDKNILRFSKKTLFLNKEVNGFYEVSKINLNKRANKLYFSHIQDSLDTQLLMKITKLQKINSANNDDDSDKVEGYTANLSKKELKKFLKMGGFTKHESYQKIN